MRLLLRSLPTDGQTDGRTEEAEAPANSLAVDNTAERVSCLSITTGGQSLTETGGGPRRLSAATSDPSIIRKLFPNFLSSFHMFESIQD
uniref:Uncharacterized protein n=1 Tax=Angiostrongylus cantonensis TaxID=6313 RepID=A0A0K0DDB7_ANGCA